MSVCVPLSVPACVQEASTSPQWVEGGSSTCDQHVPLALPAGTPVTSDASPWVLVNPARFGFYRTNYTQNMWGQLTAAAADNSLVPSADMAGNGLLRGVNMGEWGGTCPHTQPMTVHKQIDRLTLAIASTWGPRSASAREHAGAKYGQACSPLHFQTSAGWRSRTAWATWSLILHVVFHTIP